MSDAPSLTVYALVRGSWPRARVAALGRGLLHQPLAVVRAASLSVVVERVDRGPLPSPEPSALRRYDRIMRRISRTSSAVLPFRYGTRAATVTQLADRLAPVAPLLREALARVDGCVQYSLRIHGSRSADAAPALAEDAGPGARFLHARSARWRTPEVDAIDAIVAPLVRAEVVTPHAEPPLLASVYHLVHRDDVRRYRAALARATRSAPSLHVRASGPWPPYSFAVLG